VKRILITGATGFIGRQCLDELLRRGYEVHAVGRQPIVAADEVLWHRMNLLKPGCADRLVRQVRPSHLLHLAWVTTPGEYWSTTENLNWIQASIELVHTFAETGGRRAVCAGTCAEYDWRFGYCTEDLTPLRPATLYGASKAGLRQIVESFALARGFSLAWARIFFPYGPHEAVERLLPSVINRLLRREQVPCTTGDQIRDFMYVRDVANALVALLDSDVAGAINIASGEPVAIRKIVTLAAEACDGLELVRFGALPVRDNDPPLLVADVQRLANEVGWRPKHDIRGGLLQTIQWCRENPASESYGDAISKKSSGVAVRVQ
jgi:nucleoside-diphosphate-sugar epimerase